MTVDERVTFDRTTEEFSRRSTMIEEIKRMAAHEAEVRASQAGHEDEVRPVGQLVKPSNDVETIRSLARGEIRSAEFGANERRDVLTSSTGSRLRIFLMYCRGSAESVSTTMTSVNANHHSSLCQTRRMLAS